MPHPAFTFRTFSINGVASTTVNLPEDLLDSQEHLVPVLEAAQKALRDDPPACMIRLIIGGSLPVLVQCRRVGDGIGFAHLTRAVAEGC